MSIFCEEYHAARRALWDGREKFKKRMLRLRQEMGALHLVRPYLSLPDFQNAVTNFICTKCGRPRSGDGVRGRSSISNINKIGVQIVETERASWVSLGVA